MRTDSFRSAIVRLNLPAFFKDPSQKFEGPITALDQLDTLVKAPGYSALSDPQLSPNGNQIIFSMKLENGFRDLFLYDFKNSKLEQLTNDREQEKHPVFSEKGDAVIYSADENLPTTDTRTLNLIRLDLKTRKRLLLTSEFSGADYPNLSKNRLVYGRFRSFGYQPVFVKLDGLSSQPLKPLPIISAAQSKAIIEKSDFQVSPPDSKPYSVGNTLWPRLLLPIFFYTESDIAIGAKTGSWDPLQFHSWDALGFYLSRPNRPGGALSYVYRGWAPAEISAVASAGISSYGQIVVVPTAGGRRFDDYYERTYYGAVNAREQIPADGTGSDFYLGQTLFFERRESLLEMDPNAWKGKLSFLYNGQKISNVQTRPEEGNRWGGSFSFTYAPEIKQGVQDISPRRGERVSLSVEYSPKAWGSDFRQLTTVLNARFYRQLTESQYFALQGWGGMQWLDPLYQRSFALGGSFGDSPFVSLNRRVFLLRGLPTSRFTR